MFRFILRTVAALFCLLPFLVWFGLSAVGPVSLVVVLKPGGWILALVLILPMVIGVAMWRFADQREW